jgi:hypothetical protein
VGLGQVNCWDAAQLLSLFAQDRGIGARARYQADCETDFRERVLRAHCAESIGRGKNNLKVRASRFKTAKELGRISRDRIASALHHHGVGWSREAEIERFEEDVGDPTATYRICCRKAKINAVESLRCAEIQVSRYLCERGSSGRLEGYHGVSPQTQRAHDSDSGGGLADLR